MLRYGILISLIFCLIIGYCFNASVIKISSEDDAFVAQTDTWTYITIKGARCANGSNLPVAVNLGKEAKRIVLYFQGGGACWDAETCFISKRASRIEESYDKSFLLRKAQGLDNYLFSRVPTIGPFSNASFVYIPYCTGDFHAGTQVRVYETAKGPRTVHHVGELNTALILKRIYATIPTPERVYVVGVSAGGYGATLNSPAIRATWPGVRVDIVNDSGVPIDPSPERWTAMRRAWGLQIPNGCTACEDHLSQFLPFYSTSIEGKYRFALLSFASDSVIASYLDLSPTKFSSEYTALLQKMDTNAHQQAFTMPGDRHMLLVRDTKEMRSNNVYIREWMQRFVNDDPNWSTVGPLRPASLTTE